MQLTRFTDLGLRAMMLLAAGEAQGQRVTTGSIAAGASASENHIAKAVSRLSELGMVHARRGRAGGLALTDEGRHASVGRLVRALEGDREVVECGGDNPCPLVPACRLRRALAEAKEAFYRELDRYTVADLAREATLPVLAVAFPPTHPGSSGHSTTPERNPR
ncbi:rrf2 family protein, putative transcriptional regulator [Mycolicibacterium chubuense NBB4]|uniref:Rrf2 family protein, putative transcriptional regulator n=1 Tax=Mycolicibacterium chubuense (strain NBB4) TaxID=710421 RepID=I4BF94_MYCCN|nr:Rrf2 family transcriptional regulator [Mycolicibacterium chubuense]AFM15951.1 rrf2 family protein, putative transcriptional regulator [Mycolicibacterium chubuense NBB4]